jgi:hypothetical protein
MTRDGRQQRTGAGLWPGLVALLLAAGCSYYDPIPATVDLHTTLNGTPHSCMVQVFNEQGSQIQLLGVNDGHVVVEKLTAGTYTFKFEGFEKQMYPAVRTVKLFEAGEVKLTVELSQAADPASPPATSP